MNKITFAGKIPDIICDRVNKGYEIIVPSLKGEGGWLAADSYEHGYTTREIVVLPPNCKYTIINAHSDDIHIVIEQATLSLKQPEILSDVENNGIRHAAEQAFFYNNCDINNKEMVLNALGNLLVSYIELFAEEEKKLSPVTKKVRGAIDKSISDTAFSLEQYLKSLPLNYDYIRKLFKKETGVTPHEYLTGKRMELAQLLILCRIANRYSDYTVSQLAEACGYTDPLYFSRVFKKHFGMAPAEYKARNLKK